MKRMALASLPFRGGRAAVLPEVLGPEVPVRPGRSDRVRHRGRAVRRRAQRIFVDRLCPWCPAARRCPARRRGAAVAAGGGGDRARARGGRGAARGGVPVLYASVAAMVGVAAALGALRGDLLVPGLLERSCRRRSISACASSSRRSCLPCSSAPGGPACCCRGGRCSACRSTRSSTGSARASRPRCSRRGRSGSGTATPEATGIEIPRRLRRAFSSAERCRHRRAEPPPLLSWRSRPPLSHCM